MRIAGVILALLLATSAANAETLPFEIVRMLPETNQVLVYDRAHNTHVLLQPGSTFEDYVVVDIRSVELIVEKQQQRFSVYPREARYLSLSLFPRAPAQPPVIFGKSVPDPDETRVADANTIDAKSAQDVASALAMLTRAGSNGRPALTPPLLSSTLKR